MTIFATYSSVAANGPTILLVLEDEKDAFLVQELWRRQSTAPVKVEVPSTDIRLGTGVSGLTFVTVSGLDEARISQRTSALGNDFLIAGSPQTWLDAADLLKPFCEGRAGHQFLGDSEDSDALMLISYKEGFQIDLL